MTHLQTGDRTPAFNLADQTGTKRRLGASKSQRVFLFFYPKANTASWLRLRRSHD